MGHCNDSYPYITFVIQEVEGLRRKYEFVLINFKYTLVVVNSHSEPVLKLRLLSNYPFQFFLQFCDFVFDLFNELKVILFLKYELLAELYFEFVGTI